MNKQRLSITLSQSTLSQIDQLIDKKKVRSRSHAIETILQKQLKPAVSTAVILAGGSNKKSNLIKPLIKHQNQPLIFHIIDHLLRFDVTKIIILTHCKGQKIKKSISKKYPKLDVRYIFEKQRLGTGGALKNAQKILQENFYCFHGDVFTDINLQQFASFHQHNQGIATIAVKPRMAHQSFDNISVQGNQITAFQPKNKVQNPSLVNSGIYLFEPEIMDFIPDKKPTMLEKDVFPQLTKAGKLYAFAFEGIWFDITTEKQYQQDFQKINRLS